MRATGIDKFSTARLRMSEGYRARARGPPPARKRARTLVQLLAAALMVGSVLLPSAMPAAAAAPALNPSERVATVAPAVDSAAALAVQNTLVSMVAAIAIPDLIGPRMGSNEAAAIGALRTITTAQSLFREGDKDKDGVLNYAQAVGTLHTYNLIDETLGSGEKQGYLFSINPRGSPPEWQFQWSAEAVPAVWGHTGARSFYVDESGVIRQSSSNCTLANHRSTPVGEADPSPDGGTDCTVDPGNAAAMAIHEASAIGVLRTLTTAQSLFREGDKDHDGVLNYAASLSPLGNANLIDATIASGEKQGYSFTIISHTSPVDWQFQWAARAVPVVWGHTGAHSFYVDESGVIRYSSNCTLAASSSPPVGGSMPAGTAPECGLAVTGAHVINVGMLSSLDILSGGTALMGAQGALLKGGSAVLDGILIGLDVDGDQALSFQDLLENPLVLDQRFASMGAAPVQGLANGPNALSLAAPSAAGAGASTSNSFFDVFTDYSQAMADELQLGIANEVVNFTVPFSALQASGVQDALALAADVPSLDHFKCYTASGASAHDAVALQDMFDIAGETSMPAKVQSPRFFCNPATKVLTDGTSFAVTNPDGHLTGYALTPDRDRGPSRTVAAYNQFGDAQVLSVGDADYLFAPTQKLLVDGNTPSSGIATPTGLDHFQCRDATTANAPGQTVTLQDQFDAAANSGVSVKVGKPVLLCNPTRKVDQDKGQTESVGIGDAGGHLVCYEIQADAAKHDLVVNNQFGAEQKIATGAAQLLCVPSVVRVPHPNGAVLALFDALTADIAALPRGSLTDGQADSFLGTLSRAREDYSMGKVCSADTEMAGFLEEAAALREAANSDRDAAHHDDENVGGPVPQSTDANNGAKGNGGGGQHGSGHEGGKDNDDDSPASPATVALAEDIANRGSQIRSSFFDSFFDVFFDVFVANSPCFDPSVGRQPQLHITQSDNTTFSASVDFGAPSFMTVMGGGETWTQVDVPGLQGLSGSPGLPAIPYWRALLAVPSGATAGFFDPPAPIMPPGNAMHANLYPYQTEPVDAANDNTRGIDANFTDPPFVKDAKAYQTNAIYPPGPCKLTPMGQYRDLQMAQLICAAGQYNPVNDELRMFHSISFKVAFTGGNGTFINSQSLSPFESSPSLYKDAPINHEAVSKYVSAVDISALTCAGEELLILTHPNFRSAADNLSVWKEKKGIATTVIEVGSGTSYTTGAQIDALIEHRYDTCSVRPSYVLLLGDAEFVPPSATNWNSSLPGGGGDPTTGSDWGYAVYVQVLFDAFFPDFAVARMPVNTAAQADLVVNKAIAYESNPPFTGFGAGGPFYTTAAFPSLFQCCRMNTDGTPLSGQAGTDQRAFVETAEGARDTLVSAGKSVERIYTESVDGGGYCTAAACPPGAIQSPYSGSATPNRYFNGAVMPVNLRAGSGFPWDGSAANIISAFNQGRFLIFHRDHGGPGGWGSPGFGTGNLASLNNSELLPFLYSVNCASGFWDQETDSGSTSESFMEQILTMAGGGMVGGLGDNRNSPTWANNALSRGFFDATWPNMAPEFGGSTSLRRLGDILNHGKMYMLTQLGVTQTAGSVDLDSALSELIMWHAFGDPTLEMWTSNPHMLNLAGTYKLAIHGFNLSLEYASEGATITAYRVTEDGLVPYGRGMVVDHNVTIAAFLPGDSAPNAEDLTFSASFPNAVSVGLAAESTDNSGNIGAPAAPAGWTNVEAPPAATGSLAAAPPTTTAEGTVASAAVPLSAQGGPAPITGVETPPIAPVWQPIDDARPAAVPPATPVFAPTQVESHDFSPSAPTPGQTVAVSGDGAGATVSGAGLATACAVAIAAVLSFHFAKRPAPRGVRKKSG